ncbi:hypothetical protein ACFFLM_06105 [Deinococcus oregonensis]|uniref:Uncharacterized protein n=1 Tax=Deinococcus oregonensis TaxID=1805970 RepID=A0ABV6AVL3_9DEIO
MLMRLQVEFNGAQLDIKQAQARLRALKTKIQQRFTEWSTDCPPRLKPVFDSLVLSSAHSLVET